jgi:hypothetical protein
MSKELAKITGTAGLKRGLADTLLPGVGGLLIDKREKDKAKTATAPAGPIEAPSADMPEPDSEAVNAARRRRLAALQNRGGRQSTILSQAEPLGGA